MCHCQPGQRRTDGRDAAQLLEGFAHALGFYTPWQDGTAPGLHVTPVYRGDRRLREACPRGIQPNRDGFARGRILCVFMHLERILARTRQTVAERKQTMPIAELETEAAFHAPRGFARALRRRAFDGPAILAEIKKASPSRGLIRAEFEPRMLARQLRAGGAAALSVLTDEPFFQGSLEYLEHASEVSGLPCLRKDFIVDTYQIVEARAHRADAILLIAAALTDPELEEFTAFAHEFELDVLCEVHTAEELARVRDLGCDAYGVNNRDLVSFEIHFERSLELVGDLPEGAVHIAESGIRSRGDIEELRAAGYHAFLIGESLMRQADPGAALAAWLQPISSNEGMR